MRFRAALGLALALGGGLAAVACDGGPLDPRALRLRLAIERAEWERVEPPSYAYEVRRGCFCDPHTTTRALVEVEAGEVVAATYLETVSGTDIPAGAPVPADFLPFYVPVEGLFDLVEAALDAGAATVEVEFNPALHYPTAITIIHCAPACPDDGTSVEATALAPRFGDG